MILGSRVRKGGLILHDLSWVGKGCPLVKGVGKGVVLGSRVHGKCMFLGSRV